MFILGMIVGAFIGSIVTLAIMCCVLIGKVEDK